MVRTKEDTLKLCTTSFSEFWGLPDNILPISIDPSTPLWWRGRVCESLSPDYISVRNYKRDGNLESFKEAYNRNLNLLNREDILEQLRIISKGRGIAFVSSEESHREVLANWFREGGVECYD